MSRRIKLLITGLSLAIVCLLVLVVVIRMNAAIGQSPQGPDKSAIQSVVTEAFASTVTLVVVPEPTAHLKTEALAPATTAATLSDTIALRASSQAIAIAHSRLQNRFAAVFKPESSIGQKLYSELQVTIEGQSKGRYRALGGGIRDIQWRDISVNGDRATVTVSATLWSRVKSSDENGKIHIAAPTTSHVKIFSLQKVNGHWLVDTIVNGDSQSG